MQQRRTLLAQTNSPICGSTVALILMVVSTLVRFFAPRRSSLLQREESSGLSPVPLMGRISKSMLNHVLSLALANNLVSCVRSNPCASSPLLSVLSLHGQWTYYEMKSCSEETTSRRLSMALVMLDI